MITIKELLIMCEAQVKMGNGDVKIFISDDEEGNGYHRLYFGLEALKDIDKDTRECIIDKIYEEDLTKTYENYALLG